MQQLPVAKSKTALIKLHKVSRKVKSGKIPEILWLLPWGIGRRAEHHRRTRMSRTTNCCARIRRISVWDTLPRKISPEGETNRIIDGKSGKTLYSTRGKGNRRSSPWPPREACYQEFPAEWRYIAYGSDGLFALHRPLVHWANLKHWTLFIITQYNVTFL